MRYEDIKKEIEDGIYELKQEQTTLETLLEAVDDIQSGIRTSRHTLNRNHAQIKEKLATKIDAISEEVDDLADEIGSDYYVKTRGLRESLRRWNPKKATAIEAV